MKRTFTLQLYDLPEGRAFTCPTCNAASFQAANARVVCKACSPFLEVSDTGVCIRAVCRWATEEVIIQNITEAMEWCDGVMEPAPHADIPDSVFASLRGHFDTRTIPVHIVLPTTAQLADAGVVSVGTLALGTIVVTAGADIQAGEMVVGGEPRATVGKAKHAAKAGEEVTVMLNEGTVGPVGPEPASYSKFQQFLQDLADKQSNS